MNETSTQPHRFMPGCNPLIQQARQDRLDALYEQDGRHDPAHPAHQTYTGLWAKYGNAPCTDEAPLP
jgi:hypothetical protein